MAQLYVQDLVGRTFGPECVEVDGDGDLPFPYGTAMLYLSVVPQARLLRVWSRAVYGIEVKKAVLREVNEVNATAVLARAYAADAGVWVEGYLPLESVQVDDLRSMYREVGGTAHRLGPMLAAVFGGSVTFPDEVRDEGED